ncbi:MAG TPA: hypothetical protein VGG64_06520 [Pirellulales bacterium]|jgi:hypothetical protein
MKSITSVFLVSAVLLGTPCRNLRGADIWEKIDNSTAAAFDVSTGSAIAIGSFGLSVPLVSDSGLPAIPGHVVMMSAAGDSISFDVFYDGLAADFPANGSLDLHFQVTPPSGLSPSGLTVSDLAATGSFPGSDFDASGLLIAQWAGTHHFAMSTGGKAFVTITGVTSGHVGLSSSFDVFTDLSRSNGSTIDPTQPLFNVTLTSQNVPEPDSILLAAFGFDGVVGWRWKRRVLSHRVSSNVHQPE